MDSDGARFIEDYNIEFIEEIEFSFKNANDETLEFTGVLNGLRNESVKNQKKIYNIDFTSMAVRKNEQTFITESFREQAPEEIVRKMVQKLEGQENIFQGTGKPMTFLGTRKRPTKIIEYVLTHGVSDKAKASNDTNKRRNNIRNNWLSLLANP